MKPILLLLITVAFLAPCFAQHPNKIATTKVLMLVSDTSSAYMSPNGISMQRQHQCFSITGWKVEVAKEEGDPPKQIQKGKVVIVGISWKIYTTYYDLQWHELPFYVWQTVKLPD